MLCLINFALIGIFEVLKLMHKLGVDLDAETYTDYVFKNFPDTETAHAQLKVSLHVKFVKMTITRLLTLCSVRALDPSSAPNMNLV